MGTHIIQVTVTDGEHEYNIPYLVAVANEDKLDKDNDNYVKSSLERWLRGYFGEGGYYDTAERTVWEKSQTRAAKITKCQRIYDQERFKWMSKETEGFIQTINL